MWENYFAVKLTSLQEDIGPHLQVAKKIDCHKEICKSFIFLTLSILLYLNHYINWLFWCKCAYTHVYIYCVVFHYWVLMWPLSLVKDISHISSELSHAHDCYCIFKISNLLCVPCFMSNPYANKRGDFTSVTKPLLLIAMCQRERAQ